jgi:TPR repeat protein
MISLFKIHKIFIVSIFLLFSINANASVFSNIQASHYVQKGDYSFDKKRYVNAYKYYTAASEKGSGYAYFQLYAMNHNGEGRRKNATLATQMLHKAAKLQYPMAEVILANRYLYKKPGNSQEALRLLGSAAKKEYVYAYVDLYRMYSKGIGVQKNMNKANQYYRLAKANGYNINKQLISDIQSGLKKLGFYKNTVDGISGPLTRKSIANFQKSYDYSVNSEVSSQTLKQINDEL